MKIVICEDELVYQIALKQAIRHWQMTSGHSDVQVSLFNSSEELLDLFERKLDADLVFIDIQFPGELNGLELAQRIRETHSDITIVFCTNYGEYVYDGYTVNALRFLKKPINEADVSFCCNYVYNRLTLKNSNILTIYSSGRRYALRYAEIRFLEVKSHNLFISTTISSQPFKLNARLSDILSELPKSLFILCHRSYVVNVAHIRMITRNECLLINDESIPVSRTYMNDVSRAFDHYHQGGVSCYGLDDI